MNLALFDFDGTIRRGDSFSEFVRFAVRPGRMIAGRMLVGPLVLAYRLGLLSASRTRSAVARFGFRREEVTRLRQLGLQFSNRILPGTVRPRAIERIEWHKRQGDEVAVVSAALDVYMQPWCDTMGVQCVCTQLEERNGRFTGRYVGGDCTAGEKARRVLERFDLTRYALLYAYGDTREDREMLAIAHRRFYRWEETGVNEIAWD